MQAFTSQLFAQQLLTNAAISADIEVSFPFLCMNLKIVLHKMKRLAVSQAV